MGLPPSTGVRIGDVTLFAYSGQPADEFGVEYGLISLDGWFDGWESSGAGVQQRSGADGAWSSPQYAGPRILHLGGAIKADSWDGVTRAWDRLLAQVPFRHLGSIRVSTGEGTVPEMTSLIRQHEKPVLTDRSAKRATCSLSLIAPDPRRYDVSSRSTTLELPASFGGIAPPLTPPLLVTGSSTRSQATLVNDGTIETFPTLTVTGPCPPCRVANLTTGQQRRVTDAVPAGQTLVIDELNGTAVVGGQSRRVLGSQIALVPGSNEIAFSADAYAAGARLGVSYRPAWK